MFFEVGIFKVVVWFDASAPLNRFELYSEVMLALRGLNTLEAYHKLSIDGNVDPARMRQARQLLWDALNGHQMYTLVAKNGHFAHLGTTREYQQMLLNDSVFRAPYGLCAAAHVWVDTTVRIARSDQGSIDTSCQNTALLNTILHGGHGYVANGVVIEHCELSGHFCIEREAVVSGLHGWLGHGVRIAPLTVVQQTPIDRRRLAQHPRLGTLLTRAPALADSQLTVLSVFGVNDAIKCTAESAKASYCHRSWVNFCISGVVCHITLCVCVRERECVCVCVCVCVCMCVCVCVCVCVAIFSD
jgi:hypothetical protein